MEQVRVDIQFGLGGGAFASSGFSSGFGGSSWVSIQDVRAMVPPVLEYGIRGSDPSGAVADAGALTFALNNAAGNAARILGWYSPLNAIKRGGFDFNIPVRLVLTYRGLARYKFYGRLGNINVVPGAYDDRLVYCTAKDILDDYAEMPAPALDAQFNKRGDELLELLLNALPTDQQPAMRAVEPGLDVHPIAFDTIHEESMTMREALNQLCLTDFGRLYMIGTTTAPGGLLAYRNRHSAALTSGVAIALDDTSIVRGSPVMPGTRDDLVSKVQVTVHPVRRDTGGGTVLYELQTTQTRVQPGETNQSIFGPYRDPDTSSTAERVGGTDMVQPVAAVDYTMNSDPDGGADLTANFTVFAEYSATSVRFHITNHGAVAGYVTKLQCRGNGIYRYPTVIEREVDPIVADRLFEPILGVGDHPPVGDRRKYGQRVLKIDMPFQTNVNVGQSIAQYLANILSQPLARVSAVTFLANRSPALMLAALDREPGDRISVTERVSGLAGQEFIINGVRLEMQPTSGPVLIWCTWYLEPADSTKYWFLGTPGASELGVSTVLGF
jgi:hypothetical protein